MRVRLAEEARGKWGRKVGATFRQRHARGKMAVRAVHGKRGMVVVVVVAAAAAAAGDTHRRTTGRRQGRRRRVERERRRRRRGGRACGLRSRPRETRAARISRAEEPVAKLRAGSAVEEVGAAAVREAGGGAEVPEAEHEGVVARAAPVHLPAERRRRRRRRKRAVLPL